jgi:hypothetical protein
VVISSFGHLVSVGELVNRAIDQRIDVAIDSGGQRTRFSTRRSRDAPNLASGN